MVAEAQESSSNVRAVEFGPYKIVRRLGVGGMAETFEALRCGPEEFTQRVCLKLVLSEFRDDKEFVRLFQREARLAAKLRHSNIVGVLDFGSIEDTPYMALELVDGVDLLTLLVAERQLSFEYVARLAIEIAKGLDHAHSPPASAGIDDSSTGLQGIVHRDLSPSNIMLSKRGEIMLADFGVAKAMSGASRFEAPPSVILPDGRIRGKVPYMSPEQLRNEPLDGRSDLFALGVVLYEALSGKRPFDGGFDPATIMKILQGEHIPLGELAREAPPEFCAIVDNLLETDRDQRPSTAGELLEQLDDFAPSPRVQRELGAMVCKLHDCSTRRGELDDDDALEQLRVRRGDAPASGRRMRSEPPIAVSGQVSNVTRKHNLQRWALAVVAVVAVVAGVVAFAMQ